MKPLQPRHAVARAALGLGLLAWAPKAGAGERGGRATSTTTEASASVAVGAPTPDETEKTTRAKALYERGAKAFAAHRNADAIRYFRRAAHLAPSPDLAYNVAVAYEELGDAARALAEYRSYLRHPDSEPRRPQVERRIAALEKRLESTGVQQLSVITTPPGARLQIGDRTVGLTPWTGELEPGRHAVRVQLEGHRESLAEVTLSPDRSGELSLTLEKQPLAEPGDDGKANGEGVRPLTWSLLGGSLVMLAGGVAFEVSRTNSLDEARSTGDFESSARARGAADAKETISLLLFGFGSGLLVGGGVMLAVDLGIGARASDAPRAGQAPSGETEAARLELPCTPGFCGLRATGRF